MIVIETKILIYNSKPNENFSKLSYNILLKIKLKNIRIKLCIIISVLLIKYKI